MTPLVQLEGDKNRGVSIVTGETGAMVKKIQEVIRTESTEGIMGGAKDQQAEEL